MQPGDLVIIRDYPYYGIVLLSTQPIGTELPHWIVSPYDNEDKKTEPWTLAEEHLTVWNLKQELLFGT